MTENELFDFHSHLLPGIDDGSQDLGQSLSMLEASAGQGVSAVALTPHFYALSDHPEHFFERRAQALGKLSSVYESGKHPALFIGAEVAYYDGIGRSPVVTEFCIGESRFLLIEMPFSRWSETVFRELDALRARGIVPIIAHIERYMDFQDRKAIGKLIAGGCLIQSNAEFFTEKKTSKRAMRMLKRSQIALLGSDMHNDSSRPQQLGKAAELIAQNGLSEELWQIMRRSEDIFAQMKPALF